MRKAFLRKQVKWTESCCSSSAETVHPESKQPAREGAAEKCRTLLGGELAPHRCMGRELAESKGDTGLSASSKDLGRAC